MFLNFSAYYALIWVYFLQYKKETLSIVREQLTYWLFMFCINLKCIILIVTSFLSGERLYQDAYETRWRLLRPGKLKYYVTNMIFRDATFTVSGLYKCTFFLG